MAKKKKLGRKRKSALPLQKIELKKENDITDIITTGEDKSEPKHAPDLNVDGDAGAEVILLTDDAVQSSQQEPKASDSISSSHGKRLNKLKDQLDKDQKYLKNKIKDRRLMPRMKEYLQSRKNKNFVSIPLMAEHLQTIYPEYARKKKSSFVSYVDRAYSIMNRKDGPVSTDNPSGYSEESGDVDPEKSDSKKDLDDALDCSSSDESPEKLVEYKDTNSMNAALSNLYKSTTPALTPAQNESESVGARGVKRKAEPISENEAKKHDDGETSKVMYPSPNVLQRNIHSTGLVGSRRTQFDKYFIDTKGSEVPVTGGSGRKSFHEEVETRESTIQRFLGSLPSRTSYNAYVHNKNDPRQQNQNSNMLYRVYKGSSDDENSQLHSGISLDNVGVSYLSPRSPGPAVERMESNAVQNIPDPRLKQPADEREVSKKSASVKSSRETLTEEDTDVNKKKKRSKSPRPTKKSKKPGESDSETAVKEKGIAVQKSTLTFADVGGNERSLIDICKLLVHMRHPEVYQQLGVTPPRGFLLHGPPGCGKTLLANAIAGELDLPLLKLAATEVVSGVSGDSEEKIRDLFEKATQTAPCVIFIDEIDAITPKRETASKDMERRIVAQLLTCMDDLNANVSCHVLVIGATNRPDSLDPALRRAGRFDREICLGIPDEASRCRILEVLCRKLKLSKDFDFRSLAHTTPGYVGADLMALTREAAMTAVNRVFQQIQSAPSISTVSAAPTSVDIPADSGVDMTHQPPNTKSVVVDRLETGDGNREGTMKMAWTLKVICKTTESKGQAITGSAEGNMMDTGEKKEAHSGTDDGFDGLKAKAEEFKALDGDVQNGAISNNNNNGSILGKTTDSAASNGNDSDGLNVTSDSAIDIAVNVKSNSSIGIAVDDVPNFDAPETWNTTVTPAVMPETLYSDMSVEKCEEYSVPSRNQTNTSLAEKHLHTTSLQDSRDFTSKLKDVTSKSEDFTSKPKDVTSKSEDFTSKPKDVTSKSEDFTSKPADVTSKSADVTSKSEDFTSKPEETQVIVCKPVSQDITAAPEKSPVKSSTQEKEEDKTTTVSTSSYVPSIEDNTPEYLSVLSWLKDQPPLTEEQLQDLYITMEDFQEALQYVQPSAKREGFATVPDTTWDDIGALHEVREELQLAILAPVRHPEHFKSLGLTRAQGILLAGPPGCGKTLLAKAVANESGINFISVKGPELLNMYVGESERAVRTVFQRARNSAPCVIFFDELDALCPKRSGHTEGNSSARVVNQLLTEMDGLEERRQVFIMAATNRPDIIDPAVLRPGRLDKTLYVGLPNKKERQDILICITKNGSHPQLDKDVSLLRVADDIRCEWFTGADLAALVREASVSALKQALGKSAADGITVNQKHFDTAFKKVKPSVSKKDLEKYHAMRLKLV